MKNKFSYHLFFAFVLALTFLTSCDSEDSIVGLGKYENGTLVLNGGAFGGKSGDFTYYFNSDSIITGIFKKENNFEAGGFIQSMTTGNNLIFTAVNVSGNIDGKIQVINKRTFESVATVEGDKIFTPRFIQVSGDKAYFTDAGRGAYGASPSPGSPSLSILDLKSYEVEKRIDLPKLPAELSIVDNKAYVAIDGFFDNKSVPDSIINVIDLNNGEVINTILVKKNPYGIAKDPLNNLWIICGEGFIVKVNTSTNEVEATIEAAGIGFDVKHTFNDDMSKLYFISSVWVPEISASQATIKVLDLSTEKIENTSISLIAASGIGYKDDKVYIGESKTGTVSIYELNGTKLETFTSGDFPGDFLFNK